MFETLTPRIDVVDLGAVLAHGRHQVVDGGVYIFHVLDAGVHLEDLRIDLGCHVCAQDLRAHGVGGAGGGVEELELVHLVRELEGRVVQELEACHDDVALGRAHAVQLLDVVRRRVLESGVVHLGLTELLDGGLNAGDAVLEECLDASADAGVDPLRQFPGLVVADGVHLAAQAEGRVGQRFLLELVCLCRRGRVLHEDAQLLEVIVVGLLLQDQAFEPGLGRVVLGFLELVLWELRRRSAGGSDGCAG